MHNLMITVSLLSLALFVLDFEHHAVEFEGPPPETHFVHSVSGPTANTSTAYIADNTIPVEYEVLWQVGYFVG